jgi:uncharacterized protein YndB with AHSA1/START domain
MNEKTAAPRRDQSSVLHSTFSVERSYPVPPARVFFAFANEATKRRWFAEGEGWEVFEYTLDFRVGGSEISRFRFKDGPEVRNDTIFQDIVPNRRIVFVYRMAVASKPLSASLATVELVPSGSGTLMTYTEQAAFLDGADSAQGREEGCRELMEKLAAELQSSI